MSSGSLAALVAFDIKPQSMLLDKEKDVLDKAKDVQEDILIPNPRRYVMFPIKYHDIYEMYKFAQGSYWTAREIKLANDKADWARLHPNERFYIKNVLAFFAGADGIVNENLVERFSSEVQCPEGKAFYAFQEAIESVHSEVYSMLIDAYIDDPVEQEQLFNAMEENPAIKKKADWAKKWIQSATATFAERLLAFGLVEGVFFSGSFAAIFWLRNRGILPGLQQANTLIARDEGLHQSFACLLYRKYIRNKPSPERVYQIVREACSIEKEFQTESLPCSLLEMNSKLMCQYIEYVSDTFLTMIGMKPIYKVQQPFEFMELIALQSMENNFEKVPVNYRNPDAEKKFSLTADI